MGLSEAGEILRRHVIERRRRAVTHSATLDDDPHSAVPKMSDAQFADSCQLVQGVPEGILRMLEVWYCESAGTTLTVDAVEMPEGIENIPTVQVAVKFTLRQAAKLAGILGITTAEARNMHRAAKDQVTDKLVQRAGRKDFPSYVTRRALRYRDDD